MDNSTLNEEETKHIHYCVNLAKHLFKIIHLKGDFPLLTYEQGVIDVNKQSIEEKSKSRKARKHEGFSLGRGIRFFLKSNILLVSFILILIINKTQWQYDDGSTLIVMFVTFAEIFTILLSIIACIKPKMHNRINDTRGEQSIEWLGAFIAFVILSLFSLIFLGLNIPYPSTLIFCILMTNFMVSLYSVVFHPIALGIYKANVFQEKTTMPDYIFKYIAIYFSGINYYVQTTLSKLPLLLNKLIAIAFVLAILWQAALLIGIFD